MNAGTAMLNGTASGSVIDLDIVTPGNQRVRLDFLNMRLVDLSIDKTITFQTDSVLSLSDTCRLSATLALGDVSLKAWKTNYHDERGDVIHVRCDFSYPVFMVLCGALLLVSGNHPAWVYSDLQYSPFSKGTLPLVAGLITGTYFGRCYGLQVVIPQHRWRDE